MSAGPSLHQLETLDAAQEPPADQRDDWRFPSADLIFSYTPSKLFQYLLVPAFEHLFPMLEVWTADQFKSMPQQYTHVHYTVYCIKYPL